MTDILLSATVASILSTTWMTLAILARLSDSTYLPQAVRFLGAALVLFVLPVIRLRRLPRISMRLFHAAMTVAGLSYVLSPVLCFYALRTLPSSLASLVYTSIPLWFLIVVYREKHGKLPMIVSICVGIAVFFIGSYEEASLRGVPWVPMLCLLIGMICSLLGVWVSKRLFWLHSSTELNFWAMIFAVAVHLIFAMVSGEMTRGLPMDPVYWGFLLFLTFVITGLGTYLWRARSAFGVLVHTAVVPVGAVLIGFAMWRETPINVMTVIGAVLVIGGIVYTAFVSRPERWMGLFVYNEKRLGDRLVCVLDGEVVGADGQAAPIQLISLSLNGLGYRSQRQYAANETVEAHLPLGLDRSYISVQCRIVYCSPAQSSDFPFVGGLEFLKLSPDRRQSLIEFLARLTKAEEK